ncbi:tyrosine-type recombinase/integrase [Ureibacillus sp. GCM10028918]|uniref:tyrosine-type recombinase/integrase n=1 Tax=Ureibacillus sp. GCM10028918 TaxID=3273429 RepID=UPI00360A70BF
MLITPTYDLPIFANKFFRYLKRQHYSADTILAYQKDLNRFDDFLFQTYKGNILTEEIQKEDIQDFLAFLEEDNLAPNSILRHLSTLKSFYKFLVFEMDFKVDVAGRIRHKAVYTPLPEPLSFEEIEAFFQAAKEHSTFFHALFSLTYYTGSRISPIRELLKEHIDLDQQKVYFPKVKNDKDLHLPLHEAVIPILADYFIETRHNHSKYVFPSPKIKNQPVSRACIRVNIKKIAAKAGIKKRVYPHLLRHSTATHLTLLDVNQKFIATILGHSDLRATDRYQKLNVENLRSKLNKLDHF